MSAADAARPPAAGSKRLLMLHSEVLKSEALYSQSFEQWPSSSACVLWITGLAGSGKSTLARQLSAALRQRGESPLLLDGDELRRALDGPDHQHHHDLDSRRLRAWRLVKMAHCAACAGQPVVVATISLMHAVQRANRRIHSRFAEVVIEASAELLAQRRPDLYNAPDQAADLVGVGQPAQWPAAPELRLTAGSSSMDSQQQLQQSLALWQSLTRRSG